MPTAPLPAHIAIIMDGNGRWAKARNRPRVFGHRAGRDTVERIVSHCRKAGIPWLSLFAFSTENWQRPQTEVSVLMDLMLSSIEEKWRKMADNGIRLHFLGDRDTLSPKLAATMADVEAQTASNRALNVVFAINYSGQWAIMETARNLIRAGIAAENLDSATFAAHRPLPQMPPVDLLIRTSGEQRLSNFHLWETAYAEMVFCDTLWPDFSTEDFDHALAQYAARDRRYGTLKEK
ncbi:MAG: polyprenyl diphosphate synthase [Cardiobacteriaceae bacterium]|nr:polyprenyl diphosphate synthase [Cardiobacteriaceae bacterium]